MSLKKRLKSWLFLGAIEKKNTHTRTRTRIQCRIRHLLMSESQLVREIKAKKKKKGIILGLET